MFIVNIKDCILGRLGNTRINERRKQDGNSDYTDKRKGAHSAKQGKMQTRRYDERNKNWSPNLREKNIRPRPKQQAEEPDIPYYSTGHSQRNTDFAKTNQNEVVRILTNFFEDFEFAN